MGHRSALRWPTHCTAFLASFVFAGDGAALPALVLCLDCHHGRAEVEGGCMLSSLLQMEGIGAQARCVGRGGAGHANR